MLNLFINWKGYVYIQSWHPYWLNVPPTFSDCPLDVSGSNFTLVASMCSNKDDRGKCCRYINAFIAVSIARYANATSNLGVTTDSSEICLNSILQTMELYGVPRNATVFCGLGTKIPVNYDCKGRTTVMQMLQSPRFEDVSENCKLPLSKESNCRKCLNAGIIYLHRLVGTENNMTLSTCRDATYAALASQVDDASALELASCFFQVPGLNVTRGMRSFYIRVFFNVSKYFAFVWNNVDVPAFPSPLSFFCWSDFHSLVSVLHVHFKKSFSRACKFFFLLMWLLTDGNSSLNLWIYT